MKTQIFCFLVVTGAVALGAQADLMVQVRTDGLWNSSSYSVDSETTHISIHSAQIQAVYAGPLAKHVYPRRTVFDSEIAFPEPFIKKCQPKNASVSLSLNRNNVTFFEVEYEFSKALEGQCGIHANALNAGPFVITGSARIFEEVPPNERRQVAGPFSVSIELAKNPRLQISAISKSTFKTEVSTVGDGHFKIDNYGDDQSIMFIGDDLPRSVYQPVVVTGVFQRGEKFLERCLPTEVRIFARTTPSYEGATRVTYLIPKDRSPQSCAINELLRETKTISFRGQGRFYTEPYLEGSTSLSEPFRTNVFISLDTLQ